MNMNYLTYYRDRGNVTDDRWLGDSNTTNSTRDGNSRCKDTVSHSQTREKLRYASRNQRSALTRFRTNTGQQGKYELDSYPEMPETYP